MCGICGIVGSSNRDLLGKMCQVMRHRGPDDSGVYLGEDVGLGHRRLSIIDLKLGHQPVHNEDKTIWVVLNGEIYNYRSLRQELQAGGHTFYTKSDTEVIIHLYEEYGRECVHKLRGMFAFGLWDARRKALLLARDRLGIKPLYYVHTKGKLLFASEIKSLLQYEGVTPQVNELALDRFFSFRFTPGSDTVFAGVKKLLPGYTLCYEQNRISTQKYWDIQFAPASANLKSLTENFIEKLRESINLRLMSEVPLGAYLSGGLDSSFIVGLMSGLMEKPVETFSVGFTEARYNESEYAKLVADHFNTRHHTLYAESNSSDLIDKITWHLDEPLADAAVIPTYLMAQLTKQHVTVVLSGEGADELLAGYPKYKALNLVHAISPVLPAGGWRGLAGLFSGQIDIFRLLSALGTARDRALAYTKLVSVFSEAEKAELYTAKLKKLISEQPPMAEFIQPYFNSGPDLLSQLLLLDIKTWLPDDLLLKNDKMTMAHAVEARVPYLDHELVELAARIPARYKLRLFKDKYILRRAMSGIIPQTICRRKKTGFTVPLGSWFAGELKAKVAAVLNQETVQELGYFNWGYVEYILGRDLNNQYYRRQFWALFTFAMWHKVFLTGAKRY